MNILVIGKGGREHAIALALAKSPSVERVFAIPGNQGMEPQVQIMMELEPSPENIFSFCQQNQVELVVVGPEDFLVAGLVDELRRGGVLVFGPDRKAAQLEGSKFYAKEFMKKHRIPTAPFAKVTSTEEVIKNVSDFMAPFVLKADGLAAGKGVFICDSKEELIKAADRLFNQKLLGDAGRTAILEEFQPGHELSFFMLTNGYDYVPLPMVRDHKKLLDGDQGPNTGGMGTVGPMNLDPLVYNQIIKGVVEPTVRGLQKEDFIYWGVVFIGLMITERGPKVLEYNVRFGDPEAQVLMPLLRGGDWGRVFSEVARGQIPKPEWKDMAAACVVLAAENYPASPVRNVIIAGSLNSSRNQYFLHAGTVFKDRQWQTSGGRVLNAIGLGDNVNQALERAYEKAASVKWPGMQYRKDIGGQKGGLNEEKKGKS